METLRDRMEADLKIGGYSPTTRETSHALAQRDGEHRATRSRFR